MDYSEAVEQCQTINGKLPEFNQEADYQSFQVHNCQECLPQLLRERFSFQNSIGLLRSYISKIVRTKDAKLKWESSDKELTFQKV